MALSVDRTGFVGDRGPSRRANERGMALFVVVLVVTLLAAIGIFAVRVTSLVEVASGYSRRAASAFYLGEYAMNVVAADMSGKEAEYLQLATVSGNTCRATRNLPVGSNSTCRALDYAQVKTLILATAPSNVASDSQGLLGELVRPDNPAGSTLDGNFRVEMTDVGPAPTPVAGMAQSGAVTASMWQTAFTVTARVLPVTAGGQCDTDATRSSEMQSLRGYIQFATIGPTPPPGSSP
ncbi:MAG TPA: hypothetical protein VH142_21805 [Polyangiaceae bacterium]|nr:hypothetical protein [Polyangiaceae bacterium]